MSRIATTLLDGLGRLAISADWRSMVAENIGIGGIERFVQRSLLWAINSTPNSQFLASTDKRIPISARTDGITRSGEKEIDLVLFPNSETASVEWWSIWERFKSHEIPHALSQTCCGFVEIKPMHPEGFLSGDPRWAAGQVDKDVSAMRLALAHSKTSGYCPKELFALVIALACYPLKANPIGSPGFDGVESLERSEQVFWRKSTTLTAEKKIGEKWLLRGEPYPSDPRRSTFLKALLIDANPTDQGVA